MNAATEFRELLDRAANGDAEAAAEIVRRYESEVRVVARARLSRRMRPYLDSIDIAQSVHRSLLDGLQKDKFDIASPEKLIGLAVTIVRRKIAGHWRKLRRQQRDSHFGTAESPRQPAAPLDRGAEQVDADDALRHLTSGVSDTDRAIIELRLAGHSTAEAARQLDLNADVVRVRLSRLRAKLRQRLPAEE